ncbi:SMP-30/gluconolactonase/LRE family protein [Microbacterium aurantiacum]|uniref:SMP-30/gluconolactonase/LRE family protein n=1 Tax=Microbacterium aurantiacum TaxID=162393 RepID=UPI0034227BD9
MGGSESEQQDGRWIGDDAVFHGEGAFWDGATETLRHVDMLAGDLITIADAERAASVVRAPVSGVLALIRRRRQGGFVVAVERGFALIDDDLRVEHEIPVFDDPGVRMNEGACDATGRLFCGSMAYDAREGGGRLYRLDPDLSVHVALEGVSIPNGLVWTDAGRTALHADTLAGEVRAYDYDPGTGRFGASRVFVRIDEESGAPDGMALDAEGGLWVALWGGGAVHRYDVRGRLDRVVPVPVTNPTSCAFGGDGGDTLFVTTSRQGIDDGEEPFAGRVLTIRAGVRGAPVHAFAG